MLLAGAYLSPNTMVLLFFVIPVRLVTLAYGLVAVALFTLIFQNHSIDSNAAESEFASPPPLPTTSPSATKKSRSGKIHSGDLRTVYFICYRSAGSKPLNFVGRYASA